MSRTKRYFSIGGALVIVVMVAAGIWYARDSFMTKGFGLRQETPDWAEWRKKIPASAIVDNFDPSNPSPYPTPGILLRYLGTQSEILLLRHSIGDGVYSYDSMQHMTAKATDDDWQRASGEVTVCEDQRWSRPDAFNMDNIHYRLVSWGETRTVYPTYGKYAVDAIVSPSKKKAAVMSAAGPKKPFFSFGLPGLGGGDVKIFGQRYLQVMDLATKEYLD